MRNILFIAVALFSLIACNRNKSEFDASGTFEGEETIISSEASGTIKAFHLEEGQNLKAGEVIGYIDSTQLYLKKRQVQAQISAGLSRKPNVGKQIAALQEQKKTAEREQKRMSNLLKADAATQKQMDDVNSQLDVIQKQIDALESSLDITSESINKESVPMQVQIDQLNDQLKKCLLVNPTEGTVLTKYAEVNEVATPGKALYKIANMSSLLLRAYVTADQLSHLKLNQTVAVYTDDGKDKYKQYKGKINWISDKAEFTPKTIQTKEERVNLVYAIKVLVKNDGLLKLGMYADVKF
ncbi:MAG: HlyD family efflux transporter periplasmic adaptor subunit [Bacteroidetes bacterium]|nr:HlyD family efflux transporter periplasmic adaptor subunit [Bacteroidota bacterium]